MRLIYSFPWLFFSHQKISLLHFFFFLGGSSPFEFPPKKCDASSNSFGYGRDQDF